MELIDMKVGTKVTSTTGVTGKVERIFEIRKNVKAFQILWENGNTSHVEEGDVKYLSKV